MWRETPLSRILDAPDQLRSSFCAEVVPSDNVASCSDAPRLIKDAYKKLYGMVHGERSYKAYKRQNVYAMSMHSVGFSPKYLKKGYDSRSPFNGTVGTADNKCW